MAATRQTSNQHLDHDEQPAGQQVAVQLAVQGWAVTRPSRPNQPDDAHDPCDQAHLTSR
jgi:hypothetical protein